MKLYVYRGLRNETIPHPRNDYTHAIVHEDVTVIPKRTFEHCHNLVSVIMYDNVLRIEDMAFCACVNLEFIKLSKTLVYIGKGAFMKCYKIKAYCIPSTVTVVENDAFKENTKLRFIVVPHTAQEHMLPDLTQTALYTATAKRFGVMMNEEEIREMKRVLRRMKQDHPNGYYFREQRERLDELHRSRIDSVNPWLHGHMNEYPFHLMCFSSSISVQQMDSYIVEETPSCAKKIDKYHRLSPLHFLSLNPHAPESAFELLFETYKQAIFKKDILKNTPLEYAELYNFDGMLAMIRCLCEHRQTTIGDNMPKTKPWLGRLRKRGDIKYM